ncbi:hypothetical protein J3Q64DRAFT_1853937 [Phycomyces blakesleeanus]|uniref:Uncharacterized protein n=1 Tax=Phycomyces blakesleeanus TaxID=4837 RepID=A0ABR3AK64_PHYBL
MGFIERIKAHVEMWKIEKYTKRRPVDTPDFEQKDRDFYDQYYKDGVYLHHHQRDANDPTQHFPSSPGGKGLARKTTLLRSKSERLVRSSEKYNVSQSQSRS